MSKSYAKLKAKEIAGSFFTKIADALDKKDDEDERPPTPPPKPAPAVPSGSNAANYGLVHAFQGLSVQPQGTPPAPSGHFVGGFHPGFALSGGSIPPPLNHASSEPPPMMPVPNQAPQSLTMQMALRPEAGAKPTRPSSAPSTPFTASQLDEIRPIYTPAKTKPTKASASQPSTPQRPAKPQISSSSGSSPPSTPNGKEGQVQCAGTTKAGKQCSRMVKTAPALSQKLDDGDDSDEETNAPLEVFCYQHTKELLVSSGCYARKNGEWIDFSDWIPGHLQVETQLSLRIEMERARSQSDVDGYIYTYEIREEDTKAIKLKVGRAVNLVKRIDQWGKQCGSKQQVLRGFYPNPEDDHNAQTTLMKGRVKAGTKASCCHRLERLIHLELADLSATQVYLDTEWPDIDSIDVSSQVTSGKRNGPKKVERCLDCGSMHKEIFEFQRWESGPNKNKEWEKIVKPVIERWGLIPTPSFPFNLTFIPTFNMLLSANIARSALLLASLVPAVRSAVFDVIVGGVGILKYEPEFVNAAVGDQIRFSFRQKNHTATQSTFANPCAQAPGGFHSGYFPVATDVTDGFPAAILNVASTDPVWVYCAQGNHCQAGMVFAVNPGDRFNAFKAAATGAAAPSGSASTSPSATSVGAPGPSVSATGKDHKVLVGDNGSLLFEPSNIQTQPGDTITFEFRSKNHTITASSFEQPCLPIAQSTPGTLGFDSGYFPVAATATTFQSYTITVNDTRPIWAYCKQGNHCGAGMVFAANAVENGPRNFTAFLDLAKQINGTGATNGGAGNGGYGDGGDAISARVSLGAAAATVALLISTIVL